MNTAYEEYFSPDTSYTQLFIWFNWRKNEIVLADRLMSHILTFGPFLAGDQFPYHHYYYIGEL